MTILEVLRNYISMYYHYKIQKFCVMIIKNKKVFVKFYKISQDMQFTLIYNIYVCDLTRRKSYPKIRDLHMLMHWHISRFEIFHIRITFFYTYIYSIFCRLYTIYQPFETCKLKLGIMIIEIVGIYCLNLSAHQEALKKEIERLRQIYHQQNLHKMSNSVNNNLQSPTSQAHSLHQQLGCNKEKEQLLSWRETKNSAMNEWMSFHAN